MKALSVRSPWWEKILSGEKTIETRNWKTNYRGQILICATKPHGMAVCIAEIFDCKPMTEKDWKKACCKKYLGAYGLHLKNVKPIKQFPVKGKLSFYEVEYDPAN